MTMNRKNMLEEMLKEAPNDDFLKYAYALELEKEGNVNEAIATIKELIKISPDYLGAYYKLGQLLETSQQFDASISVYKEGISLATKQNNSKTLKELKEALFLLEDEDDSDEFI